MRENLHNSLLPGIVSDGTTRPRKQDTILSIAIRAAEIGREAGFPLPLGIQRLPTVQRGEGTPISPGPANPQAAFSNAEERGAQ